MTTIKLPSGIIVFMVNVSQFSRTAATITFTFSDSSTLAEVFSSNANASAAMDMITDRIGTGSTAILTIPNPPVFAITSLNPAVGSVGGGDSVDVIGTALTPSTVITFDNLAVTSSAFVSSTKITVVTPAHAGGLVDVKAVDGANNSTLVASYQYT